jgi:hypothetical protein
VKGVWQKGRKEIRHERDNVKEERGSGSKIKKFILVEF